MPTKHISAEIGAVERFRKAVFERHHRLRGHLAQEASLALDARADALQRETEADR